MCDRFLLPRHVGSHTYTAFGGIISSSGGWMRLYKELIMAGDSPHITVQRITTFQCSLRVLAGSGVLPGKPRRAYK